MPDLATALPVISDNGLKQTVTLRSGVMWNTNPPRPVTAADVVRGIKRACNPSPVFFGGMADFEATIKGLSEFCAGYPEKAGSDAAAMKQYIEGHNVSGITTSGNTITFDADPARAVAGRRDDDVAVQRGADRGGERPARHPGVYNHMYSDGPYQITSYTPKKSFHFVRNPQWQASTDPVRKAYVNAINVDETGNQTTIYQQMPTNSPSLGMSFDALPPPADTPNLLNQVKSGSHDVNLAATYSSNPYLIFNVVSPNNGGALGKADVRQALSYGIQRSQLMKVLGGPIVNPPLTHILPAGIDGSQDVPAGYNPYPYNQAKAKSMLVGRGVTPRATRCRSSSCTAATARAARRSSTTSRSQLNALGSVKVIGVPTNQSDFYGKYLVVPNTKSNPSPAYKGTWDMAGSSWGPDWYGNSAVTYFNPLFSSPGGFPANGGSNFGFFSSTDRQQPDQAGAEPAHRGRGRQVLGPGRPAGHEGGGDLPDHLAAAAHVARVVRA